MSILLFGQKAERTHENHMLREFIQALETDWGHAEKDIVLIANSMWNGAEIDLVCILPSAFLLVDFKDYRGYLTAAENGPWMIDGVEVRGGSKENPYQQLRDNKFSVMSWLNKNNLLLDRNISHISAAVVFTGPVTDKPNLSGKVSRWFYTADFLSCSALLTDLSSPELKLYSSDLIAILNALGVGEISCDYGQANRAELKPLITAPIKSYSKPEQLKSILDSRESGSTKISRTAQNMQQRTVEASVPARKSRLVGMFKSVTVVVGIFVVMMVVSQIYPIIGQSSTIAIDELKQKIELNKTSVSSTQPQPMKNLITQQKAIKKTKANHIETNSVSRYVGQEITACGTVAQYVPFAKGAYLNFDKPSPQQTLTLVIWDQMFSFIEKKLGSVSELVGTDLCVRGYIEKPNQRIEMQIAGGSAIRLK